MKKCKRIVTLLGVATALSLAILPLGAWTTAKAEELGEPVAMSADYMTITGGGCRPFFCAIKPPSAVCRQSAHRVLLFTATILLLFFTQCGAAHYEQFNGFLVLELIRFISCI